MSDLRQTMGSLGFFKLRDLRPNIAEFHPGPDAAVVQGFLKMGFFGTLWVHCRSPMIIQY